METIAIIEHGQARENWEKLFPGKEVYAYCIAKKDVSEEEIGKLQKSLLALCWLLESRGDGIYHIATRKTSPECLIGKDFSSTCKKMGLQCETPPNIPEKVAFSRTPKK